MKSYEFRALLANIWFVGFFVVWTCAGFGKAVGLLGAAIYYAVWSAIVFVKEELK